MLRTDRFSRPLIALIVLVLGLVLSDPAFGGTAVAQPDRAAAPTAHAAAGCGATWIRGLTENRTPIGMRVAQTGERLGNRWCRSPEDEVRTHSSDSWLAGDESGATELNIVYLLPNHDRVLFQASAAKDRPAGASCAFVDVVRTPREYECQAEVVAGGSGIAFVRFSVLTVRR